MTYRKRTSTLLAHNTKVANGERDSEISSNLLNNDPSARYLLFTFYTYIKSSQIYRIVISMRVVTV